MFHKIAAAITTAAVLVLLSHIPSFAGEHPVTGPSERSVAFKHFGFDADAGEPVLPEGLKGKGVKKDKPGFVIIKFRDRFNQDDRARLVKKGVKFYGYIPVNAFLAKVPPGRMDELGEDDAVEFLGEYHPAYRLSGELLDSLAKKEKGKRKLVLQAFDGEDLGPIKKAVEELGGSYDVMADGPGINEKFLRVELDVAAVEELVSVDGVLWLGDELVPVLHNDKSQKVLNVDDVWVGTPPLKGTGQIVAVCDTGLDTGNTSTMHPDFSGTTSDGKPKIKQTFAYGRAGDWSDDHGHGTHTSGSAVGGGNYTSTVRGMAYDAQLVFQSTLNAGGGLSIPDLNATVLPDAYNQGARVHSNSWGTLYSAGVYSYSSMMADTFIWNNPDMVVLFAAGNDGVDNVPADGVVDYGSVSAPSTAKNIITVGASENDRPTISSTYGHSWPSDYPSVPIKTDRMCDKTYGMVAFSGRGPCDDGRLKPDIVAPGTFVLSAKSSEVSFSEYWYWPSGLGYPSAYDDYFAFYGGTSMSCPLAAGSAALVREFFANAGMPDPSAALVKGTLIAGAYDMTPGQYGSPDEDVTARPDNSQGWGRLDAKSALYPDAPRRVVFVDEKAGLTTGASAIYSYEVVDATVDMRVNLVWSDYPSLTGAQYNIVNDLDLIVTAPDGTVYHGNRYSGSESIPDDPGFDRLNNVEGVTIPVSGLSTGTLTVEVSAFNVVMGAPAVGMPDYGPQPFAVALSGGLEGAAQAVVTGITPSSGVNNLPNAVAIDGDFFDPLAAVSIGSTPCQVTGVTTTRIDALVPAGIAAGTYDVDVTNPGSQPGTLPSAFEVVQDAVSPAAPQGLAASPGKTQINLKWTPNTEPDLTGYTIFFGIYSTTVGTVDTHALTGLTNGQSYDIYMKALDAAGNVGPASNTVSATPYSPDPELPHYSWDGSAAWTCDGCHLDDLAGELIPSGFDYRTDPAFCLSCHNTASVAHGRPIDPQSSHGIFVNVTAGSSSMPTFGSMTSGEYSDTMYTHLRDGTDVVCTTCHNTMRKLHDPGRAWEFTSTADNTVFRAYLGGWWDQGQAGAAVYNDSVLWTPSLSKDRALLRVPAGDYGFDEYSGTVVFSGQTSGYVYLSLDEAYLRVPGSDNTACLDCHSEATHRSLNCLSCHAAHGTVNIMGIRSDVRLPGAGHKTTVFERYSGAGSFADGDAVHDGVCEVCHTATQYYRSDGSGASVHLDSQNYDGADCTLCHTHAGGFSP